MLTRVIEAGAFHRRRKNEVFILPTFLRLFRLTDTCSKKENYLSYAFFVRIHEANPFAMPLSPTSMV